MLGFIRKSILSSRQNAIKSRHPNVSITLHAEMSAPSMQRMISLAKIVSQVNVWEPQISVLSDEALRAKTQEFKAQINQRAKELAPEIRALEEQLFSLAIPEEKERVKEKLKHTRNRTFIDVLAPGFAVVREASKRTTGLRHFDVQIAGGIILHEGRIAEMATGEGKTLVATLPVYLNALLGKGVHVVTVNDYLARRDAEWMGPIYEFLGLSVGVIQHEMSDEQRKAAYGCDVTYGTNNEFGFDYLRDNMKYSTEDVVQRPFYFAIVDEVDSILIDEARTPLIISGPAEESTDKYYTVDRIVPRLKGKMILEKDEIDAKHKGVDYALGFDYIVDEKAHSAYLTEEGESKVCSMLGIPSLHDMETMEWRHHIIQALRAHKLYEKDVDYVVKDGEVIIVDEFTGRMMPGRRWSDGLHQAVEAKEGMKIERENQTLATITFQNYFRMYEKLAGMTGTAFTEAAEFKSIYALDVVTIPTNRKLVRNNYADRIYKTEAEKFEAVIEEIIELYNLGRPVLVGTISIERSERLSEMLKRRGISHQVLNAKYHEMEAQIVAQAGRFRGVTIATNMAGRGTDILLGGNPVFMAKSVIQQKIKADGAGHQDEYKELLEKYKKETSTEHDQVVELGGLHVLGTERHEARRVDNQLRGRCGRQGDPGSSRFYVSLGDELMRLFGSDRLIGMMDKLGLEKGQVIEHPWVSKSIEIAQRRVEQHNFEIRKQLLDYDNVMNKQREVIYTQRRDILEGASLKEHISGIIEKLIEEMIGLYANKNIDPASWDLAGLTAAIKLKFGIESSAIENSGKDLPETILSLVNTAYNQKEAAIGEGLMRHLERMVFLQIIDAKWKDHLYAMDSLREGIGLRAYGQRDPLIEYKREAFDMFSQMIAGIEDEAVEMVFKLAPPRKEVFRGVFETSRQELVHPAAQKYQPQTEQEEIRQPDTSRGERPFAPTQPSAKPQSIKSGHPKVGRNDSCPCGSGKKYKKCCGK